MANLGPYRLTESGVVLTPTASKAVAATNYVQIDLSYDQTESAGWEPATHSLGTTIAIPCGVYDNAC